MDVRFAIEHAVSALEPGGALVEERRLTGGVSADVFGLCIATPAGGIRRVVFRQHRPAGFKGQTALVTAKEHALLTALHAEGFAVPEPFLVSAAGGGIDPYLVTEWVDGSTVVATHELPAALEQMAQFLVRLHSWDAGTTTTAALDHIEDPVAGLPALLPARASADRLRTALAAGELPRVSNRSVLLHGDYWPGNVLWRNGTLVAVIDWEDACLGDPLADLATARVELLCQYGTEAMDVFTTRYLTLLDEAASAVAVDVLPVWEAYVSAAALSSMHAWNLEPADEARRRHRTERHFDDAVDRAAHAGPRP